MAMNPRLLRPSSFSPKSISGLALWLDGSDAASLYTTDAGPGVEAADEAEIAALAGLEAWWDASDESTVTLDSGRIAGLADKSGNGRDAVNATTGTTQPEYVAAARNGRNVARFDAASTQRLTVNSSQATFKFLHDGTPSYVVAVFSTGFVADPNGLFGILGNNISSTSLVGFSIAVDDRTPTFNMAFRVAVARGVGGAWAAVEETGSAFQPQQLYVADALFDADNATAASRLKLSVDGSSLSQTNTSTLSASASNATANLQIGAVGNNTLPHSGDICEIIVFSQQPSASQRARIAKYLAAKWGISNVHAPATSGAPVGYWRDKSGNNRHATQATAESRPTVGSQNGRTALTFDGTDDRLQTEAFASAISQPVTAFAVHKFSSTKITQVVFDGRANRFFAGAGSSPVTSISTLFGASVVTGDTFGTQNRLVTAVFNQASSAIYQAGALVGSGTVDSATLDGLSVGHIRGVPSPIAPSYAMTGDIEELIFYNRALTTSERRRVESYLARRWGIALAPQVSDADAQSWVDRVYAAGSTVSQPVANSVSAFVTGCKSDGIWEAMKSVVLLAGADTLAGALVPLKQFGLELWSVSTPSISNFGGSVGAWDGGALTMSNTALGSDNSYPRFTFSLSLVSGSKYAVSGRLSGDTDAVRQIRLAASGASSDVSYNSSTGVFTASSVTASASQIQFIFDGTLGAKSVTIESLSIREFFPAPTSYNFVSGDYSKTSGLVGNGSTKYLDSNRAGNADPQDDNHMAMWVSDVGTTATQSFVGSVATVETYLFKNSSGGTGYLNNNASTGVTAQYPGYGSLLGMSRSQASEFLVRLNGAIVTRVSASAGVNSIDAFVFARNSNGTALGHVDSTLAFYSIGESLDLALLDARVSSLMTDLGVS